MQSKSLMVNNFSFIRNSFHALSKNNWVLLSIRMSPKVLKTRLLGMLVANIDR